MRGRRSKANAQDTTATQQSTGWGSWKALFKEGTQVAPNRTLKWELGVEAGFETGVTWVPSFSNSFSGAETVVGGEFFGIIKISRFQYAAENWGWVYAA